MLACILGRLVDLEHVIRQLFGVSYFIEFCYILFNILLIYFIIIGSSRERVVLFTKLPLHVYMFLQVFSCTSLSFGRPLPFATYQIDLFPTLLLPLQREGLP